MIRFRKIKDEIRVLGIDDAPFKPKTKGKVLVVGTIFRGGHWLDGVLTTEVDIDGRDATRKISEMASKTKHRDQLRVIIIDGVTLGGFNVVDIEEVNKSTGLPVITVMRHMPDMDDIKKALDNFKDGAERLEMMYKAGEIYAVPEKSLFIQVKGMFVEDAREIIINISTMGNMPECLRASHLIASGVVDGESRGRA